MEVTTETILTAKDLRVGNYIQTATGEIKQIIEVRSHAVVFEKYMTTKNTSGFEYGPIEAVEYLKESYYNEIQPITLTVEFLEKCGFEKEITPDNFLVYYKDDFYLEIDGDKIVPATMADYPEVVKIGKAIQYLHQMQNLFYSLTSKELEVTLT